MTTHQTYLNKFKGDFWNHCIQQNVFNQNHLNNINELTKIIDNIVSNYQSHIFQNENPQTMYPKLITELKNQLLSFSANTSQELKNIKLEQFQQNLEQKQHEFNSMMKKEEPNQVEFVKVEDEPLSNDKLEALIAEQMKEREHLVQDNNMNAQIDNDNVNKSNHNLNNSLSDIQEQNVVLANKFINLEQNIEPKHVIHNKQQNNEEKNDILIIKTQINDLFEKIDKIHEYQKKHNMLLNKMITSQISILEKLK